MIYLVDDDSDVRQALSWLLRTRRLLSSEHASGEAFLSALAAAPVDEPSCVLLDVRMPGMSGLAVFERLIELQQLAALPVIFLTGHAEVATAVDAVKRGAFDFCEKPFSDNSLIDRVEQALAASTAEFARRNGERAVRQRIAELTERERQVMQLVAQGLLNKQVADQLDISVRTVEVHRARVFDKMAVRSAVELANVLAKHPD
jgi:two-component system, LuxR family, response regulator DctR